MVLSVAEKYSFQRDPAEKTLPKEPGVTTMNYDGFQIESFEAGKGLWHARIRRADQKPVVIDGVLFSTLEVGFAWSSPEAAVADAKTQIDHLNQRCATVAQMTQAERPAAS
jgi:hypothetical protein